MGHLLDNVNRAEHTEIVAMLDARARALNLTPTRAARLAGVKINTLSRWRLGQGSPRLVPFKTFVGKMEAFLDAEEQRLRNLNGGTP